MIGSQDGTSIHLITSDAENHRFPQWTLKSDPKNGRIAHKSHNQWAIGGLIVLICFDCGRLILVKANQQE